MDVNKVYSKNTFPSYVFKENYENFYFLDSTYILCDDEEEYFSNSINQFLLRYRFDIFISLVNNIGKWKPILIRNEGFTKTSFCEAMNDNGGEFIGIKSAPSAIGIFPKKFMDWTIYCDWSCGLAVIGSNSEFSNLWYELIKGIALKDEDEFISAIRTWQNNNNDAIKFYEALKKAYIISDDFTIQPTVKKEQ